MLKAGKKFAKERKWGMAGSGKGNEGCRNEGHQKHRACLEKFGEASEEM